MNTTTAAPPSSPAMGEGLMGRALRPLTVAIVALISILAFEHLAVATVMPVVAQALGGQALYAAAFGVAMASSILGMALAGRWCDRAGAAPVLWAGVAAFVAGVCLVGLAPTMPVLVAGRALQGLGAGVQSVVLYVLVGQAYPRALHPRMFATFAAAWVIPVVVGPALAGWMAQGWGWRWVFLSAVAGTLPAALLLAQGLARLAPPPPQAARPLQQPNMGLALAAALAAGTLYAAQGSVLLTAAAVAVLAWCAPRLLPRGSFTGRAGLPTVVVLRGLAAAAFFCGEVLIPLLLVGQRGLTPLQAGLVLTVGALGWSAGSALQGRLALQGLARVRLLRLGMGATCAGSLLVLPALWPAWSLNAALLWAGLGWTLAGLGIGLVFPTLSVLTLECAPPGAEGTASSALQLADALFSAVGLALAHALLAALQPHAPTAGFTAGFGVAAGMALLGVVLAARVQVPMQVPMQVKVQSPMHPR